MGWYYINWGYNPYPIYRSLKLDNLMCIRWTGYLVDIYYANHVVIRNALFRPKALDHDSRIEPGGLAIRGVVDAFIIENLSRPQILAPREYSDCHVDRIWPAEAPELDTAGKAKTYAEAYRW
jgi:hypothetical protein